MAGLTVKESFEKAPSNIHGGLLLKNISSDKSLLAGSLGIPSWEVRGEAHITLTVLREVK